MPDVSEQMFRTNRFGSFRELGGSCVLRAGSKSMIPGRTREYGSRREKRYVPVVEQMTLLGVSRIYRERVTDCILHPRK